MDFVPFEIAKKLKEKGFREKCVADYWEEINERTASFLVKDNITEDEICILDLLCEHNKVKQSPFIDAPTISQVLKWLREEKKLHISIEYYFTKTDMWDFQIRLIGDYSEWRGDTYSSYEEAALAGIEYTLDNLI